MTKGCGAHFKTEGAVGEKTQEVDEDWSTWKDCSGHLIWKVCRGEEISRG